MAGERASPGEVERFERFGDVLPAMRRHRLTPSPHVFVPVEHVDEERFGYHRAVEAHTHTPSIPGLAADGASAIGSVLAEAARQLTRIRRSSKGLHPVGTVVLGTLTRLDSADSGVAWLDSIGTDEVLVRLSRAVGLPGALPDIYGLALRVPAGEGHADILLASTGLGRLTRYMLTAGRDITARPLTTLIPYQTARGPLMIAADPVDREPGSPGLRFDLLWSVGFGPWARFAELTIPKTSGPDPDISFDAVTHPPPGLRSYPWARRMREPAYQAARETSGRG